jgi:HSP20 family molecular chaperone IbpA
LEQRNAWERTETQAQMGLQGDVWPWQFPRRGGMSIPLDVCEFGDEFVVRTMLPGVSPDAVNISANETTLTLTGEIPAPDWLRQAPSGGQSTGMGQQPTGQQQVCWLHECPIGKFARTITFPFPIGPAQAQSTFDNGVLTMHFPKSKSHMMKSVPVQSSSATGT